MPRCRSCRPLTAILLTLPAELQSHVLSFLPRQDLASVVRVSQHLHAVGVTTLYSHVQLRSLDQVEAFFQLTSLLARGSVAASRHADLEPAQWKAIKTLEIDISRSKKRTEPLTNLPRSLRGRGVSRFPLDWLRLFCNGDPVALFSILQCFDPASVGLRGLVWKDKASFNRWTVAIGWKDVVEHLTLVGHHWGTRFGLVPAQTRFGKVKSATIVCHYHPMFRSKGARLDVIRLLDFCPNVDKVRFCVFDEEGKGEIERLVEDGMEQKPASFFEVRLVDRKSNTWGDDRCKGET